MQKDRQGAVDLVFISGIMEHTEEVFAVLRSREYNVIWKTICTQINRRRML